MSKNNKIIVTTLPIKPQEQISIGMCIAPFLMDVISKNLNCMSIFSVNLLHSYDFKDLVLKNYIDELKEMNINYDSIFIDKKNVEKLLEIIQSMITLGKIEERNETVLRCSCGKVDIIKNGIRNFDSQGDVYYKQNNKIICKHCNTECREYQEDGLYLKLEENIDDKLKIYPSFLFNATNHFSKQYKGKYYLISKRRNTGYYVIYGDKKYNIDIDFLWMNYINLFNFDKQIIIASTHQLFEMYLINYINQMWHKKDLYFVATPYIRNNSKLDLDNIFSQEDIIFKKLCILYTLKWKSNEVNWENSILKGIRRLNDNQRKMLYDYIITTCQKTSNIELLNYLNNLFNDHINYQRNLKLVKEKKNV